MDKAAKEKGERNFLKYWIFSSPLEKGTSFHSQKKKIIILNRRQVNEGQIFKTNFNKYVNI